MADILLPEVDFIISTDASEYGGIWNKNDKEYHFNYLELKAIYLAMKAYRNS